MEGRGRWGTNISRCFFPSPVANFVLSFLSSAMDHRKCAIGLLWGHFVGAPLLPNPSSPKKLETFWGVGFAAPPPLPLLPRGPCFLSSGGWR